MEYGCRRHTLIHDTLVESSTPYVLCLTSVSFAVIMSAVSKGSLLTHVSGSECVYVCVCVICKIVELAGCDADWEGHH